MHFLTYNPLNEMCFLLHGSVFTAIAAEDICLLQRQK
jgi:hypothetical protein